MSATDTSGALFHGDDLDAAMNAGQGVEAFGERFGVCLTALDTRTRLLVNNQVEILASQQELADARKELLAAGIPDPSDELVSTLVLRGVIGGSFTYGLETGLRLALANGWEPSAERRPSTGPAPTDADRDLDIERALTREAASMAVVADPTGTADELSQWAEERAGDGPVREIAVRDFREEGLEELVDARNYCCWHIQQAQDRGDLGESERGLWALVSVIGAYHHVRELRPTRSIDA